MNGKDRTCKITAHFWKWFAVTSAVSESVLTRSMTMVGQINDYYDLDWGSPCDERFHRQGIKIFLSAPRDDNWACKIGQVEGVSHVCGAVSIEAQVKPKTYDFDGEIVEDEPVQIRFSLSVDAFNAIQQQAYDADRRGHRLAMDATLGGKSLPDTGGRLGSVFLKDLDVSERRVFAVTAVSFQEVGQ